MKESPLKKAALDIKPTSSIPRLSDPAPRSSDPAPRSTSSTETTPLLPKNAPGEEGAPSDGEAPAGGGLGLGPACMLVAGGTAGSGILALPRAVVRTGWFGIPMIAFVGLLAAFCAKQLSDSWAAIEARDPEMRTRKRNPYSIIVERALGKTWSVVASMAMIVTLFGASVVFLLIASQLVQMLLSTLLPTITYCVWVLIVAGAATPLMFFGTPKDFSFLGIISFLAAVVACILYFIQMISEFRPFVFRYGMHGFQEFFLALGTIMFAFGGTSSFPTIQNDMADKSKFGQCLKYSFAALLGMYLLTTITAYTVYGEAIGSNLASSLSATPLTLVGNVFMVAHLISAFVILINPVCQEMEELYEVSRDSMAGRFGVRLSIMLAILFIGESIPKFQSVLSLVGGSTVALLTLVLPPLCYLKLAGQPAKEGQLPMALPTWMKIISWIAIGLGSVGGVIAAVCAVSAIFGTAMTTPCYLK